MRKFRAIVQSASEPEDKYVLWIKHDSLSYFNNGEWVPLLNTPVIGEMVEEINKRVDKNFRDEADSLRRDVIKIIEDEIKFQTSLSNTNIIISDRGTLTLKEINKIDLEKVVTPIYIIDNDSLYRVTNISRDNSLYTFTCIGEQFKNTSGIEFNVYTKQFNIVEGDTPEIFNIQSIPDSSILLDTFNIPSVKEGLDVYIEGAGFSSREEFVDTYSHYYCIDLDKSSSNEVTLVLDIIADRYYKTEKQVRLIIKYKDRKYDVHSINVLNPHKRVEINTIANNYTNTIIKLEGFKFIFSKSNGQWVLDGMYHNSIDLHTAGNISSFLSEDGTYKEIEPIPETDLIIIFNS